MSLGEVAGVNAPALDAAQGQAAVVDHQRGHPADRLRRPVEEAGQDDEQGRGDDRGRQADDHSHEARVVAGDHGIGGEMKAADDQVGDAEDTPSSPKASGTASEAISIAPIAESNTTRTAPSSESAVLASQA